MLPLNVIILLVGLIWAAPGLIGFPDGRPGPDTVVIEASNLLHAAGMDSARQVLSTHLRLQDAAALGRDRFTQAHVVAPDQKSVDELARTMRSGGWRFFIYSRDTGPTVYPALTSLLTPQAHLPDLAPIDVADHQEFVIYRLVDKELAGCARVDAHFENGVRLECYEWYVSRDMPAGSGQRLGVYLSWRAGSRVKDSLKVFVHLVGPDGQLVAQHDGAPALWTWPTDTWKPGEVIVDFHQFPAGAHIPSGSYLLQAGLYDEETGARLNRVDDQDNPVDDKIILSTIQIQ